MQHRSTLANKGKSPAKSNSKSNSKSPSKSNSNNNNSESRDDDSQKKSKGRKMLPSPPSPQNVARIFAAAALYVLSGSTQPILMTLVKQAGLGDSKCQLYMLFYYLGPAMVSFSFCFPSSSVYHSATRPTRSAITKSVAIASIDIVAQSLNYTGSTFCGPTIFAIIYSSVTIWTALFSRIVLARRLNRIQWAGVCVVFTGLVITAFDSAALGEQVMKGAVLVFMGSTVHAMTYVLSEAIMTGKGSTAASADNSSSSSSNNNTDQLDVATNCAVQGLVACLVYLTWQLTYTLPRFQERIVQPVQDSGTSLTGALAILIAIGASNLVHALTFFYTLKCFPGGATSAGVMKGLQAVLVFVFTSVVYCDRTSAGGGGEMCFTEIKFLSLVVVVGGVMLFAVGTDKGRKQSSSASTIVSSDHSDSSSSRNHRNGYAPISVVDSAVSSPTTSS